MLSYVCDVSVAFAPLPALSPNTALQRTSTRIFAATATVPVEVVKTEDRFVDVAAFRNGLVNPEMMMQQQQEKRDAIDKTKAALDGLKIGLLYIGPPVALIQWFGTESIKEAALGYLVVGGGVGAALAINNFLGKSVYVPTEAEATNRIIVDFAEGIMRGQDLGFVALSEETMFDPCHGVMACVDAQLRNSPKSPPGVRTVQGLPAHLHIKNMLVHEDMRGQGVGYEMVKEIEKFAKQETDAELLTLEVEDSNTAAVRLYTKAGFQEQPNPAAFTKRKFMTKSLS